MSEEKSAIQNDVGKIVDEWIASNHLKKDDLFVIGCSTSEVAGKDIGTSGSEDIAEILYESLSRLKKEAGIHLAFQCCEHLNRALVMERDSMDLYYVDVVTVIPQPSAGGSMASYAFKQMKDSVVVEAIEANAGLDIGETMIGMHLQQVAVPLCFKQKKIGNARVNGARTRPKLIGGERAIY